MYTFTNYEKEKLRVAVADYYCYLVGEMLPSKHAVREISAFLLWLDTEEEINDIGSPMNATER